MRTGWKVRNLLGSKYRPQGSISTVSYSIIIASNTECLTKSTEEKKNEGFSHSGLAKIYTVKVILLP